ncbi:MAG: NAD-dependent succinate-semialdehyde dehydrogenase [Bdellovibrionales bacterium]
MSDVVQVVNPATEEVIGEYAYLELESIERILEHSVEAYAHWRRLPLASRLDCVQVFANALQAARVTLAEQITREMGKTTREALAEVDKCIASCHTLYQRFPEWKSAREESLPSGFSVHQESLGVILGVMPWNFPLWQVVRFAIPALLCGNTVLLKHAPNTWGVAEFIEELFWQALPHAVYQNLKIGVPQVGALIADRRVRGVSLTGSRQAGISVAELAGRHLKKVVLELGGSDAYVLLDDADLEKAAEVCARARLMNAGQSCVAAKRFIVTKRNYDEFAQRFQQKLAQARFGDPSRGNTDFGPLARRDLREILHDQVARSRSAGAKLLLGGTQTEGTGFFYPASLLAEVRPGQPAFDEELFGPVAALIRAEDEQDALRLANLSRYGLGGAIFSRDEERARALAVTELDAGMAFVNDFVRSDAQVPFGGVKDSGLGRELGREGCFEFTNIKTVYVPPTSNTSKSS